MRIFYFIFMLITSKEKINEEAVIDSETTIIEDSNNQKKDSNVKKKSKKRKKKETVFVEKPMIKLPKTEWFENFKNFFISFFKLIYFSLAFIAIFVANIFIFLFNKFNKLNGRNKIIATVIFIVLISVSIIYKLIKK